MNKKKVLVVTPNRYGVGKFRFIDPYVMLYNLYPENYHIHIVEPLNEVTDNVYTYDIIVTSPFFCTSLSPVDNVTLLKQIQKKGTKIIVDIDDYWHVPSKHHAYWEHKNLKYSDHVVSCLLMADYVTTTTKFFAELISLKLNIKNVYVFSNAISKTENQFIPTPIESEMFRFGWLGGGSHLNDLEIIRNGISSMLYYKKNTQSVLCGVDYSGKIKYLNETDNTIQSRDLLPEETIWSRYESIFTDEYRILSPSYIQYLKQYKIEEPDYYKNQRYVRRFTKPINEYAKNYNHLDVVLAPLVQNLFNNCKSQLKIIEAGFHKKPIIVSQVQPYDEIINNKTGFVVPENKKHKLWFTYLKKLYNEPNLRIDLGEALHEHVTQNYELEKVTKSRKEFLDNV